jgi:hypothetical protein
VASLNNAFTIGKVAIANAATGTKVNIAANGTINGDIASAIHFANNNTLTIGGASNITGPITTYQNNKGTINRGAATTINSDIGSTSSRIKWG